MKILITGSTGLLGQALLNQCTTLGEVAGLSRTAPPQVGAARGIVCDLLDAARTAEAVRSLTPDLVIHTQALSDVDLCEREPDEARAQNIQTITHLVQALAGTEARLVYMSTDYVFDGTKGSPYCETDAPNPISAYGRSKLEGERVALSYPRALVVRTSTLFGPGRMNFCDWMVSRLRTGQNVEAFADQVTSPTYTIDLAEGIAEVGTALLRAQPDLGTRICHVTNAGGCSRVEWAERLADLLGCSRGLVKQIAMADQRRPAPRPAYSALMTTTLPRVIGRTLRPWDDALQAYLRERHWLN